jgi:hypothetical protein
MTMRAAPACAGSALGASGGAALKSSFRFAGFPPTFRTIFWAAIGKVAA